MEKIPFQIEDCSGFDTGFPVTDLVSDSNQFASGWQSERFCTFPQSIVFRLDSIYKILKLQILVHHFKIPTRIDISYKSIDLKIIKLGYVSIQDNAPQNYSVRELKTVHVDVVLDNVILTMQKCHINHLNLYNQVGIVAFNLLGSKAINQSLSSHGPILKGLIDKSVDNYTNIPHMHDLSYSLGRDAFIIRAISAIVREKERAVAADQFTLAAQLKNLQIHFTKAGTDIMSLSTRKMNAIKIEDFELAADLQIVSYKTSLEIMTEKIGLSLTSDGNLLPIGKYKPKNSVFAEKNIISQQRPSAGDDIPLRPSLPTESTYEQPIDLDLSEEPSPIVLNEFQRSQFDCAIKVFGEVSVALILNQNWNSCSKGLESIRNFSALQHSPRNVCDAVFEIIIYLADDGREPITKEMLIIYQHILDFAKKNSEYNEDTDNGGKCDQVYMTGKVVKTMPQLVQKIFGAGTNNIRSQKLSSEFYLNLMSSYPPLIPSAIQLCVTKKGLGADPNAMNWKALKSLLEFLARILQSYTFQGLDIKTKAAIESFVRPMAKHMNVQVRDAAAIVLLKINLNDDIDKEKAVESKPKGFFKPKDKAVAVPEKSNLANNNKSPKSATVVKKEVPKLDLETTCIFCGIAGVEFTPESLDEHYWNSCVLLMHCPECTLVIEITDLNNHLVSECASKEDFKTCLNCKGSFHREEFEKHVGSEVCKTSICVLCREEVSKPELIGHLMNSCLENPRI